MTAPSKPPIATEVPWSETLTDYDRAHLVTYLRVLDALADNASRDEMARVILGIDPITEPDRARSAIESHIRRARWMTKHSELLRDMKDQRNSPR